MIDKWPNGNILKIRVSEIRVKRIPINQGVGVDQALGLNAKPDFQILNRL